MLYIPGNLPLLLYQQPMNMRKSFEGLSAAIEQVFPDKLFSGTIFIFLNKRKDHIKLLFWDNDGWVIYFKRLEKGTFLFTWGDQINLDRKAFLMHLEGVTPKRIQKRFSLGK